MTSSMRPHHVKTIARWALVFFVMAWTNLVIQAPLHAAMKQDQSAHPCCVADTAPLCDLVLSIQEQADDAMGGAALGPLDFHGIVLDVLPVHSLQPAATVELRKNWLDARQYAPPPLLLKTTLLI